MNFEVRLYEGQDKFEIVYGALAQAGTGATIGVQRGTGATFTQFSCNVASLQTGLALTFLEYGCAEPSFTPTSTRTPRARKSSCSGNAWPMSPSVFDTSRTLYRGREGMWSWVAHRVTGVLIFFFLFVHVLDTALVRVSPEDYDKVVATYKTPIVALLEYGLVAAILFHALNGLRVIAVDFWSKGPRYQKQMLWSVVGLWLVLMVGALYPVLGHAARELFGS
jgi:succinate dehydrogenase / fumarate reductase cytochrome b subunit